MLVDILHCFFPCCQWEKQDCPLTWRMHLALLLCWPYKYPNFLLLNTSKVLYLPVRLTLQDESSTSATVLLLLSWWMLFSWACPHWVTSCEVQELLWRLSGSSCDGSMESNPAQAILWCSLAEHHMASAVANESSTALQTLEQKALNHWKTSLSWLLCHITQVQTIPRYQMDAADQFISVVLLRVHRSAGWVWLKPPVSH